VTAGKRPLIVPNALNGLPGLYFDSARLDRLFSALAWNQFVTTSTANIWIVAIGEAAIGRVLSDTNGYRAICVPTISPLRISAATSDSGGTKTVDSANFDWQTGPDPFLFRYRHSAGNVYSRVNRTTENSLACGNVVSTELLSMGGTTGTAGSYKGTILEVVVCSANQSSADFKKVDNYLCNKWGLPLV